MPEKLPVHENEKIAFIQRHLQTGRTREEVGNILGYKSWRGIDILMRRHGMKWDSKGNSYYSSSEASAENVPGSYPSRISTVISGFREKDADPMEIAQRAGFENHRQLSSYMDARGFMWSPDENNYVKRPLEAGGPEEEDREESTPGREDTRISPQYPELEKYLPFLDTLSKHKERLLDLILPESAPGTVPRYTVPGITRTKSIYMSDLLSRLLLEFSQCKNISQREIVEAALIEFFRKYSFKKQVDELLGRQ